MVCVFNTLPDKRFAIRIAIVSAGTVVKATLITFRAMIWCHEGRRARVPSFASTACARKCWLPRAENCVRLVQRTHVTARERVKVLATRQKSVRAVSPRSRHAALAAALALAMPSAPRMGAA